MITISDLAAELHVHTSDVTALVDQLVAIDGDEATIERTEQVRNASGRLLPMSTVWLTDDAADVIRQQFVAV